MSDRFLAQVEATLKDPAGKLNTTSAALLSRFARKQVEVLLDRLQGQKPSLFKAMMNDQQKPTVLSDGSFGSTIDTSVSSIFDIFGGFGKSAYGSWEIGQEKGVRSIQRKLMEQYNLSRPAIALTDQEKGLVRGMAALLADRVIVQQTYDAFISELVWGGRPSHIYNLPGRSIRIGKSQ